MRQGPGGERILAQRARDAIGGQYRMDRLLRWVRRGSSSPPENERRREAGQALVEFALILPVLLLLLLAAVDFARAYFTLQVVTNAAREGARIGIISGRTTSDVNNTVSARLNSGGLTASSTISATGVDGALPGDPITVTVSYPFQTLTGSFIPGWSGTITLSQTTVMRHE